MGALTNSTDFSHLELKVGVPPLLDSGVISDTAMIGQMYVLLDSVLCFLPEATFGDLSSLLGTPTAMLPHAKLNLYR